MSVKPTTEEIWTAFLNGPLLGKVIKFRRRLLSLFASQRCKNCNALRHFGARLMPSSAMVDTGRIRASVGSEWGSQIRYRAVPKSRFDAVRGRRPRRSGRAG